MLSDPPFRWFSGLYGPAAYVSAGGLMFMQQIKPKLAYNSGDQIFPFAWCAVWCIRM
jgi:hypothetical protein